MTASGLVFVYVPLTRWGELIEFNCMYEREGEGRGRKGE
jgi:hypothetical protein